MKNNISSIKFEQVIINGLNTINDKDMKVAIYDILEENSFSLINADEETYTINLFFQENIVARICFCMLYKERV